MNPTNVYLLRLVLAVTDNDGLVSIEDDNSLQYILAGAITGALIIIIIIIIVVVVVVCRLHKSTGSGTANVTSI